MSYKKYIFAPHAAPSPPPLTIIKPQGCIEVEWACGGGGGVVCEMQLHLQLMRACKGECEVANHSLSRHFASRESWGYT